MARKLIFSGSGFGGCFANFGEEITIGRQMVWPSVFSLSETYIDI